MSNSGNNNTDNTSSSTDFKELFEPNDQTTLKDSQRYVADNVKAGVRCPCCNSFVKAYLRSINSANALCLVELYKISEKMGYQFYHINELKMLSEKFLKAVNGGEFARMRHYGFIVQQPKSDSDRSKKTSGFWMLTEKGKRFAQGETKVLNKMLILNNKVLGYDGEYVSIDQCFDEKFSYESVMSEFTSSVISTNPEQ